MDIGTKKFIFINKSQITVKGDEYVSFEKKDTENFFRINHRNSGMNEEYLKSSLHWHNFYEFEFVYGGEGTHIFGKTDCEMKRGFVCFRTPANLHTTIENPENKLKLYNIQFSEEYISYIVDTHLIAPDNSYWVIYDNGELERAIETIREIFREVNNIDKYSFAAIKAKVTGLFIDFARKQNLLEKNGTENKETIKQVVEYIRCNFRDNITLKEIAQKVYLTPNYLGELLKKETGKTFSEYVNDLRFALAVQLLVNTKHTVSETAYQCGFNSVAYFIKKFKERYGCSPLKFRNSKDKTKNR